MLAAYTLTESTNDGTTWLLNSLLGRFARVKSTHFHQLIRGEYSGGVLKVKEDLLQKGFLDEDNSQADVYRLLVEKSREVETWRLGYLLDYLTIEEIEKSPGYVTTQTGITEEFPGKLFLYLWVFSRNGIDKVCALSQVLPDLPKVPSGLSISLKTDGTVPVSDSHLESLAKMNDNCGNALVTFVITKGAAKSAGGTEAYCRSIAIQQAKYYSVGFLPYYCIWCTEDTVDYLIEELFPTLCSVGIYPRNFALVFGHDPDHALDITCEHYNPNWNLYISHGQSVAKSSKYQVFDPLFKGVGFKLRAMLRSNMERTGNEPPETRHCPFSQKSLIFGSQGRVSSCPVVHGRVSNSRRRTLYSELFWGDVEHPNSNKYRLEWDARTPSSISKCQSCSAAPLCAGGCPLMSLEKEGTLDSGCCPPVQSLLRTEISIAKEVRQC